MRTDHHSADAPGPAIRLFEMFEALDLDSVEQDAAMTTGHQKQLGKPLPQMTEHVALDLREFGGRLFRQGSGELSSNPCHTGQMQPSPDTAKGMACTQRSRNAQSFG